MFVSLWGVEGRDEREGSIISDDTGRSACFCQLGSIDSVNDIGLNVVRSADIHVRPESPTWKRDRGSMSGL